MKKKVLVGCSSETANAHIENALQDNPDFEVSYSTTCGWESMNLITAHEPDVAILCCDLKKIDALTITKLVVQFGRSTKIVLVNNTKDLQCMRKAIEFGALGYISSLEKKELEDCLRTVTKGEHFVDTELYHKHYFSKGG